MHVRTIGRGRPCVLLHGYAMNSRHWLPFIMPHIANIRFFIPDLRGFGLSHTVPYHHDNVLLNYAEDLEDLILHYDLDHILLGGISMGAYTCLQYNALKGFDRISAYLHVDQGPQWRTTPDWQHGIIGDQQDKWLKSFMAFRDRALAVPEHTSFRELPRSMQKESWSLFGRFVAHTFPAPWQKRIIRGIFAADPMASRILPMENWRIYTQCFHSFLKRDYDMRPLIPAITTPVRIFMGRLSTIYPPAGQVWMHRRLPASTLISFEKSGHALMVSEPVRFFKEFSRFLHQGQSWMNAGRL